MKISWKIDGLPTSSEGGGKGKERLQLPEDGSWSRKFVANLVHTYTRYKYLKFIRKSNAFEIDAKSKYAQTPNTIVWNVYSL